MKYLSPAKVLKGAAMFALLLSSSLIMAAQKPDSAQISNLFTEIKEHASLAEHDAELLDSYTRSHGSWKLHAYKLHDIKEHVNDPPTTMARPNACAKKAHRGNRTPSTGCVRYSEDGRSSDRNNRAPEKVSEPRSHAAIY